MVNELILCYHFSLNRYLGGLMQKFKEFSNSMHARRRQLVTVTFPKNVKLQRRIFLSTSLHLIFLKHSCISVDPDQNYIAE